MMQSLPLPEIESERIDGAILPGAAWRRCCQLPEPPAKPAHPCPALGGCVPRRNIADTRFDGARLPVAEYFPISSVLRCLYRKSNPDVLMVQSSQEWLGDDAANCLNRPRNRRILAQR